MDPPRVMSTQHPDNATLPFFVDGEVVEGDDEIQEAYYVYSHLGCDEQMWDFEGKEGDEYAVQKLLSRQSEFFEENILGDDVRLTVRGPNPDVQPTEAKVLLEILESVPRSYDAAKTFADECEVEEFAPIHEVIVPMVTSAEQLLLVRRYYEEFVVGKADKKVAGDRTVSDWVGEFEPGTVSVIPLLEDRQHMLDIDGIVGEYVRETGVEEQRVFLARSDPALNYGSLSADLLNRVALSRIADLEERESIDVYPMLGAGSAPFRGGLSPENAARVADTYPSVETFTAQSAFKYDRSVDEVRDGVETLKDARRDDPPAVDEDRALETVGRLADAYGDQIGVVAPTVNRIADFVPGRRARRLHVGLFGYSREVGENALPRAITYTAALYSVGLPPEMLGVHGMTGDDLDFVDDTFPLFYENLEEAVSCYNPRAPDFLGLKKDDVETALELVDAETDNDHLEATDAVIDGMERGDSDAVRSGVRQAASERGFLG
ncbi:MAG: phosphoenolpyruvate carboxylase [Halobacteriales archaeon]|nr:phosphoenolpyruvate carboxylase [Halobacteriales archaeon]